jgi:hypothetical protein
MKTIFKLVSWYYYIIHYIIILLLYIILSIRVELNKGIAIEMLHFLKDGLWNYKGQNNK